MSLITTNDNRIVIKHAESMMLVPYVYDSTIGDYVLGNDVYDISAVIGDSITLEQSDGNTETKNNEFIGTPLLEVVSGSKFGFTAQCLDLQNKVLKTIFGAMTVSNVEGAAAFNDDFILIYVLARIRFKEENLPDVVLPKMQLNSKLMISQLKTRASQGNIAGTALCKNVAIENDSHTACLQFSVPSTGGTTYTPYTPVLLVPRSKTPLFYKKSQSSTLDIYSSINFTSGEVSEVLVKPSDGTIQTEGSGGSSGSGGGSGQTNG